MSIPTLRILTRKTKLRFGRYRDKTVQELIKERKHKELISAYYKLSSVNYTDDVLKELKIVNEYVIDKPGVNKDKYDKFVKEHNLNKIRRGGGADKMKKETRPLSKATLRSYNQHT